MNTYEDIIVEKKDHIAIITLNRPDVLNAMRMKTKGELTDAIDVLGRDDTIYGILITGAGKAFGAGSDIHEISVDREGRETTEMSAAAHRLMDKIETMDKPVIAVINGYALGGGLELALACDMRVMSSSAKVGLPEVELGVAPCYGGTQRLPRLIGASRAKDMLFTGRHVGAEEALQMGLVNRVYAPEKLMSESFALMEEIIRNAPVAVKFCKRCVNKGIQMHLGDGLSYEAEVAGILVETEDAKEGVNAFFEKRKPQFKNR